MDRTERLIEITRSLCPEHKQHTCLGLIEITDTCNLNCPTCFADAKGKSFLTKEQVTEMLDLFVERAGTSIKFFYGFNIGIL